MDESTDDGDRNDDNNEDDDSDAGISDTLSSKARAKKPSNASTIAVEMMTGELVNLPPMFVTMDRRV